jgi:uncharacterized protein YdeI (YjbR/CyaY-like superfamily)
MIAFASQAEFEAWLDENHETSDGVWLKYAKEGSGVPSVTYAEAVEVALCYGWIDGQARSIDDQFYQQRFTPRTKRSKWSAVDGVGPLRERGTQLRRRGTQLRERETRPGQ